MIVEQKLKDIQTRATEIARENANSDCYHTNRLAYQRNAQIENAFFYKNKKLSKFYINI